MEPLAGLEFYFKITPVRIVGADRVDPLGHWLPPDNRGNFRCDDSNSTGWCHWSTSAVQTLDSVPGDPAGVTSCSIFFDYERQYFLLAQADCTTRRFEAIFRGYEAEAWRRLGFRHVLRHGQPLSLLQFDPADHFTMHARGGIPQLLPRNYDGPGRQEYANVAGKLLILLGLAAFTSEPESRSIVATIRDSFRLPYWNRNYGGPLKDDPSLSRMVGYVVKVAPIRGVELEDYEEGYCGPLLYGRY
ncbi:hypothetical protein BGW36DRAFT_424540 [Talaromyces proteolyticus]|uniref:Uncharacterized protein n=1 Tax=Talaromyces proteolyticus TaxID=1131652 RepID=A0AAD4KYR2_9EURO|nr:uncharacterized protein BGW36DRAFT_424540 [Talaromyces proteolyticus]KAH8702258.1 hypothetical protein BGW36DRAFT_424540 [Talaromyces proteolyticus]